MISPRAAERPTVFHHAAEAGWWPALIFPVLQFFARTPDGRSAEAQGRSELTKIQGPGLRAR